MERCENCPLKQIGFLGGLPYSPLAGEVFPVISALPGVDECPGAEETGELMTVGLLRRREVPVFKCGAETKTANY